MRNRELHDALRTFALEAAATLRDDQAAGAEVEFDLEQGSRRGGPALYHYRPLTGKFIADRWRRLRALPSRSPAALALGTGAGAYLRLNGLRGSDADPALQALLERLYEDATDFAFPEERFERVYAEVEQTLYEAAQPTTIVAALHGVALEGERAELGEGLALVRGDLLDAPEAAIWAGPGGAADGASAGDRDEPNVLVTLTREAAPEDRLPLGEARERFRALLTGLRLWKPGGVALAGVGWRRIGEGAWQAFELEQTGVPRGERWVLAEDETDDLRRFLEAIAAAATPSGSVGWALDRFEMGCGRSRAADALSDYLLALRALLERDAAGAAASLALRVAVLCAEEGERRRVQRRVELAQALERFVIGDAPDEDYVDAIGSESPRTLVDELERHLRALLRDVLCGYLDPNLRGLSDDLLLDQPAAPAAGGDVTTEIEAIEAADIGATARGAAWEDDAAGYSAPV